MDTKEKQRLVIGANYEPVSVPRGQSVKKTSRCQGQSIFCTLELLQQK